MSINLTFGKGLIPMLQTKNRFMVLWGLGWFLVLTHKEQTYTVYKVQLLTKIWNVCVVAMIDLL